MASGQFITVKLMRSGNQTPWGFRLQGGKEFQTPLSIVKINNGSLAEQSGLQIGDIICKINGRECEMMRHKEAQDAIVGAGNYLELYLDRGPMNTWKPTVTPVGDITRAKSIEPQLYTKTSLAKSPGENQPGIGSGHNSRAQPFSVQSKPALVHKQFNSPINLYSDRNLEETLNAHTQVLASGATGINFMRPDAPVNKESAVYQMVHDEEMRKQKGISSSPENGAPQIMVNDRGSSVIKHVEPPSGKPNPAAAASDGNKNICSECERLIVGVFVRINNRPMHAECFRCATCGTSLKNIGYFNINDKLYCDIHAKQMKVALGQAASFNSCPAPTSIPNGQQPGLEKTLNGVVPKAIPIQYESGPKIAAPAPFQNNLQSSYQAPQPATPSNGFQSYSNNAVQTKYTPVAPPTAPKPNFIANRQSMYQPGQQQPSYSVKETSTSTQIVSDKADRQTFQQKDRPFSCYSSLPSAYSVTTNTYQTRTSYGGGGAPSNNITQPAATNNTTATNLYTPNKTASYASSSTVMSSLPPQTRPPWTGGGGGGVGGVSSGQGAPSYATSSNFNDPKSAPKRGKGLLQSQLTGGVIPFCGYCSQPIRGQYIMALNKTWCPNHFICANSLCKRSLEQNGFVEEQGRLYCEMCYETHFAPTCSKCRQRIKGDCLNALDKQWHPDCFTCSYCRKPFGNSSFYLEDGQPYCEKDWNDLFTTKCVGCGYPIAAGDRWVEALNQNYHSNCFRCTVCQNNLEGQSFFAKGGRPFCKAHAR